MTNEDLQTIEPRVEEAITSTDEEPTIDEQKQRLKDEADMLEKRTEANAHNLVELMNISKEALRLFNRHLELIEKEK